MNEVSILVNGETRRTAAVNLDRLLDDPSPPELLSRTAREAHERGVFGVPSFFFEGQMYWGNDRLVLLEHAIRAGS